MKKLYYKMTNYFLQNPIITVGVGRILGIMVVLIYVLCQGCSTNPKYIDGSDLAVGVYVPMSDNLVGIQVLHYLNGVNVQTSSNQPFKVERKYSSTNSYFGIINTVENSDTKVEVKTGVE